MRSPTKMPNLTEQAKTISSTMSPKSAINFLDLPPEILRMIATLLDEEQLPALRRVSKQICYHLSDIFASVHFAHLHHHLTKPSLQDLIHITNHAMFSTYIKSIQFSTARMRSPPHYSWAHDNPNALAGEDSRFRQKGRHIDMLVTVLKNLKHHGNHKVSLGAFDNLCSDKNDILHAIGNNSTCYATLGHGYVKSYGIQNLPSGINPYATMFAISRAAEISGYSLRRFSVTAAYNSSTQTKLIKNDQANLLLNQRTRQFNSNLTLKYVVVGMLEFERNLTKQQPDFTVEMHTGVFSHLSLQGRSRTPEYYIRWAYRHAEYFLRSLPSVFTTTKYRKLTLSDLQLMHLGLIWLCSKTKHQAFECLEISNVNVWVDKHLNHSKPSAFMFLNHFKSNRNIKMLEISNFTVNARFSTTLKLKLAAEGIVAEGYDQVQSVFDDLIAQTSTWHGSISGT